MSYTTLRIVPRQVSAGMFSLCVHAAVLLLLGLAAAALSPLPPSRLPLPPSIPLTPRLPVPNFDNDSGGGADTSQPARKGKLPDARPQRMFIRPMVAVVQNPLLPIEIGMTGLPDLDLDLPVIGDPFAMREDGLLGIGGTLGGLGDGSPGKGIGPGGDKSGISRTATALKPKITRPPQLISKFEPEYSEPARKARLQGYVRLKIDVGLDGRPINIQVIQGIGLGLDEAAIDAVKRWRFHPAMAGDKPVVAPATIEVGFHLI